MQLFFPLKHNRTVSKCVCYLWYKKKSQKTRCNKRNEWKQKIVMVHKNIDKNQKKIDKTNLVRVTTAEVKKDKWLSLKKINF